MNLELLRTFLEVSHARNFGRAAEALSVTPAAVSARIKQLEEHLGTRVFDRIPRDIRLTPAGTQLVRYADLLISEGRKGRQDVSLGGADAQMQGAIAHLKLAAYAPDVVVHISRESANFFEFHRAEEMAEVGYAKTSQALDQFGL